MFELEKLIDLLFILLHKQTKNNKKHTHTHNSV